MVLQALLPERSQPAARTVQVARLREPADWSRLRSARFPVRGLVEQLRRLQVLVPPEWARLAQAAQQWIPLGALLVQMLIPAPSKQVVQLCFQPAALVAPAPAELESLYLAQARSQAEAQS